jgi:hypothetical protein
MVLSNDAAANSAAAPPPSSCNGEYNLEATDMKSSPIQNTATGLISPLTMMKNDAEMLTRFPMITAPLFDTAYSIKINQAREKTKRSFDKSKLLENAEYVLPRFEMNKLVLGKVLGHGGFGTVLEINAIHDVPPPQDEAEKNEKDERVVFRIDEFEERKKHQRKPITLGWRLRRSWSGDGFEDFMSNQDRGIQVSKSYDCITGHHGCAVFPKQEDSAHCQQRNGLKKSASDDEMQGMNSDYLRPSQIVSHNFSFLSWRDSKAGEEGNDALPLEEKNRSKLANNEIRLKALHQARKVITHNATDGKGEACYVVKLVSQSIVEDDFQKFLQASKDLATETHFLSVLHHPHILKIRAVGEG